MFVCVYIYVYCCAILYTGCDKNKKLLAQTELCRLRKLYDPFFHKSKILFFVNIYIFEKRMLVTVPLRVLFFCPKRFLLRQYFFLYAGNKIHFHASKIETIHRDYSSKRKVGCDELSPAQRRGRPRCRSFYPLTGRSPDRSSCCESRWSLEDRLARGEDRLRPAVP